MKPYNYSLLLGKMRERGETQASVAAMLGISQGAMHSKLHSKTDFTRSEISKMCSHLEISDPVPYFFAH